MNEKVIHQVIGGLVRVVKEDSFTDEARNVPTSDALGLILSKFCEWDGEMIVKTAVAALEDANFDEHATLIEELWNHLEERGE